MFLFLFIAQLIMPPLASAGECETQLKKVLASAKATVNSHLEKGSPCHNAALIGRKNGLPGCNPPAVFELKSLLTPTMNSAKAICSKACADEGKSASCKSLISTAQLKQYGIEGLNQILNVDLPIGAAFNEESTASLPSVVEI